MSFPPPGQLLHIVKTISVALAELHIFLGLHLGRPVVHGATQPKCGHLFCYRIGPLPLSLIYPATMFNVFLTHRSVCRQRSTSRMARPLGSCPCRDVDLLFLKVGYCR